MKSHKLHLNEVLSIPNDIPRDANTTNTSYVIQWQIYCLLSHALPLAQIQRSWCEQHYVHTPHGTGMR